MKITVEWIKKDDATGAWRLYCVERSLDAAQEDVATLEGYGHKARIREDEHGVYHGRNG